MIVIGKFLLLVLILPEQLINEIANIIVQRRLLLDRPMLAEEEKSGKSVLSPQEIACACPSKAAARVGHRDCRDISCAKSPINNIG